MKGFRQEIEGNILPFWINQMLDLDNGGFYGRIDGMGTLDKKATKGIVLNARILWTFSAAYRVLKNSIYLEIAKRAYNYIKEYFIDDNYGGVFWELDYKGRVVDSKKQTYAQGFTLYAFSEYFRATGDNEALKLSIEFFETIERYKDKVNGGYFEAFQADWSPISDMRLSEKDANEKKSMNTHLHILEPYTNLLHIWKSPELYNAQTDLISLFCEKIINRNGFYQNLFFDENWTVKSEMISFGHDIESSWLLLEAAEVLSNQEIKNKVLVNSLNLANSAQKGLLPDGSLAYEIEKNTLDSERHWWVQAEGVVGFMYAYKYSGNNTYKDIACNLWEYIEKEIVDDVKGEWYWSRLPDGNVNKKEDKAGFWKCPYHNSRMCLEMIENFGIE